MMKHEMLAAQLYFAAVEATEGPTSESGDAVPPSRWSPMRAKTLFGDAPPAIREQWIEYAKKVAGFAGL